MSRFNYSDGTALAKMMSNRTFVIDNQQIPIDQYGQRQMNWTLNYFDEDTGQFQVRDFSRISE